MQSGVLSNVTGKPTRKRPIGESRSGREDFLRTDRKSVRGTGLSRIKIGIIRNPVVNATLNLPVP